MKRDHASRLVPDARIRERDTALEEALWNDVVNRLYQTTPRVAPQQAGLAYFEPLYDDRSDALVHALGGQAAVAPSRSMAKLGAYRAAPGRTIALRPSDLDPFLQQFQTVWLPDAAGASAGMVEKLVLFGYRTLRGVARLEEKHLTAQFGPEGTALYRFLHPGDTSRVKMMTPLPRIKKQHTFEEDVSEPATLQPALRTLVERACRCLGRRHCQRIEVRLVTRRGGEHVQSRVLRGLTAEETRIAQQAEILLDKLLTACLDDARSHDVRPHDVRPHDVRSHDVRAWPDGQPSVGPRASREVHAPRDERMPPGRSERPAVQMLTVILGALGRPTMHQGSLFATRPDIEAAARAVSRRYPGTLLRAFTNNHAVFEEDRFRFEPLDAS